MSNCMIRTPPGLIIISFQHENIVNAFIDTNTTSIDFESSESTPVTLVVQQGMESAEYDAIKLDMTLDDSSFQLIAGDMSDVKLNTSSQDAKINISVDGSEREKITEVHDIPVSQIESIDVKDTSVELVHIGRVNYDGSFTVELGATVTASKVVCAYYDDAGKPINIEVAPVSVQERTIRFIPKDDDYCGANIFILNDGWQPMCEAYHVVINRN